MDAVGAALAGLIPVRSLSIVAFDPGACPRESAGERGVIRGFEPDALRDYTSVYRAFDPMGRMFIEPPGRAARLTDHLPPRDFGRDAFTGEFLPRYDLRHILAVVPEGPGGLRLGVALHRTSRQGDFTDPERDLLFLLSTDLASAAVGALAREEVTHRTEVTGSALVLDAAGRPLHADPQTTSLLQELGDEVLSALMAHARGVAARGEGAVSTRVLALGDRRALAARASSFKMADRVFVLVVLTSVEAPVDAARVVGAPALTRRERQVAQLVVEGLSNREIAYRLGISPATVAVHVTRVLRKRGARGRIDLVRGALRDGQFDGPG